MFSGKGTVALDKGSSTEYSAIDGVISHLKIYNYCKTDFKDAMEERYIASRNSLYDSSELIEISKDNVTYYKVGSPELPLVFEEISHLDEVTLYIRSNFYNCI